MRLLNAIILAAVGLASAALSAPAPELPTVTINFAFPTTTAVMIDKREKTKTSTSCTSTKKKTTSCTTTLQIKTTTSCTTSKKTTTTCTTSSKVAMAKIAAATTACINTITVPFPSMNPGAFTAYASTSIFTKTVECTKGCFLKVATASNPYPQPTKTVTSAVTTRTVHACSPTNEAKKWRA